MSDDDFELFQQMMQDVKPLTHDTAECQPNVTVTEAHRARRTAATHFLERDPEYLSLDSAPMLKPDEIISFKRNGIQEGVFRKLRLGKYPIQARLDLHRRTLTQAREEILAFFKQCLRLELRTVMIVHGKGERSNPPALIKSYVAYWLPQINDVQCMHSTQQYHGGTGAVYVLLKKSPQQKLENKEHHQKRLG